jgi:RNA polymerase sigma-70 factor (ECF subfamily)
VAEVADRSASSGSPGRGGRGGVLTPRSFDPPDEHLLALVADGDSDALGALYDRYSRLAYSQALRVCGVGGPAEDAVREVFLALWRDPQWFDPGRGRFSGWLLTVVHHRAVDAVRRDGVTRRIDLATPESVAAGQVGEALGQLSGEQRRTIGLAFYGGYTQREVAAITGVSVGTAGTRLYSGTQRLRGLLTATRPRASAGPSRGAR